MYVQENNNDYFFYKWNLELENGVLIYGIKIFKY